MFDFSQLFIFSGAQEGFAVSDLSNAGRNQSPNVYNEAEFRFLIAKRKRVAVKPLYFTI